MKKILLVTMIIVIALVYNKSKDESIVIIPDNSLRFRLIASSSSLEDKIIKNEVKKEVEKEIATLLKNSNNINKSRKILNDNLENIEVIVENTLRKYNTSFDINFGENYFPKKIYKGVVYKEGMYESLVITLGKGNGDNWWCVLFPPLCLLENTENATDVEYRLFVSSIINHFK